MTTFQPLIDKENVGASSSVKNRVVSGLSLKGQVENASLFTPRQALGNVNRNFNTNRQTPLSKKLLKTPGAVKVFKENSEKPKPRKALSSISENKKLSEAKPKTNVAAPLSITSQCTKQEYDEIEHIHKPREIEDDYEDIYPKEDRISSYLDKLISWRPSCFKSWDIDGDFVDDEPEPLLIEEIDDIPAITSDVTTFEEMSYSYDPEPLPMPDMDISVLELSDFLDLPQELDEKILL